MLIGPPKAPDPFSGIGALFSKKNGGVEVWQSLIKVS